MQLIRFLAVALACAAGVIGYIQEGRRLNVIKQLPGDKARAYYESQRGRNDRILWVISLGLAAAGALSVLRLLLLQSEGTGGLGLPPW